VFIFLYSVSQGSFVFFQGKKLPLFFQEKVNEND